MTDRMKFASIFQLPPAMMPYIDLIATRQEVELVVLLGDAPLAREEIAEAMTLTAAETEHILKNAYQRDIIDRESGNGVITYSASNFYANMDYWTSFETGTWRQLPRGAQAEVSEWQMQAWIKLWAPEIETITRNPDTYVRMKNRDVLLLEEALELVGAAEDICLLPCPCKTTMRPSSPVIEGSMRLGERARVTLERGQGRQLTTQEAQAHLIGLDRMGLIHSGPRAWRENDPKLEWISHGNCHPDYSFPIRAGIRLGLAKVYPRVHYVAQVDEDKCTHCGLCAGRCLFNAFFQDGSLISQHGHTMRQVKFDPEPCWGCGVCANACPEGAIEMRPL